MDGWHSETSEQKKKPLRIIGPVTIRSETGNHLIRRSLYFQSLIFNIVPTAQSSDLEQMIEDWMIKWDRVIQCQFVVTLRMTNPRSKYASLLNTQTLLPKYSGDVIGTIIFVCYTIHIIFFQKVTGLRYILISSAHLSLCVWCIFLTAIGFTPAGSSTVHIYTQTVHRTTQITNNLRRVRAVPRLREFYSAICLTTQEKAWKNLSQGKKNLSQVKKTSVRLQ